VQRLVGRGEEEEEEEEEGDEDTITCPLTLHILWVHGPFPFVSPSGSGRTW